RCVNLDVSQLRKNGCLFTTQHEVAYAEGLGDGDMDEVSELLSRPRLRVVGLVIDKVDRIMHGMELGAAGMPNAAIGRR
ncbi:MAG: hypothetical protein ACE5GJ_13500, partial [Gemmatimonadota bacterium]